MTTYEIPLTPETQRFKISLDGVEYSLFVRWNHEAGAWVLDLSDTAGALIVGGVALTTGADLLEQYRYLGFTGSLYVQTDYDKHVMPTAENLGETSHLYFVVDQ